MKKILLAALCAVSTTTLADSKVFEGFSTDLSTGYQNTERDASSTLTSGGVTFPFSISKTDESKAVAVLGAAYSMALSSNYLLGIGFDYDFTDHDTGNPVLDGGGDPSTVSFELTDAMSLYLKPQLMLTDKSQIYAKLAYIRADLEGHDSTSDFVSATTESLDGYSIGGGFASMISDNVSLFVEANYFNYGTEEVGFTYDDSIAEVGGTLYSPSDISGYNAKIGIAYTFK